MNSSTALEVIEVSTRPINKKKSYRTDGNIIYFPDYSSRETKVRGSRVKKQVGLISGYETKKYLIPGMLQLIPLLMAAAYLSGSFISAFI